MFLFMKGDVFLEFHSSSIEDVLQATDSTEKGLSSAEAKKRLERDGFNELAAKEKDPIWKLFLENFKDPMVIVLLIAAIVQIILGEIIESIIIFAVLMINAVISVIQTRKAESSLDALRQLSAPEAKVLRDGVRQTLPARELVRGDIVLLEAGDYVPADERVGESGSLKLYFAGTTT